MDPGQRRKLPKPACRKRDTSPSFPLPGIFGSLDTGYIGKGQKARYVAPVRVWKDVGETDERMLDCFVQHPSLRNPLSSQWNMCGQVMLWFLWISIICNYFYYNLIFCCVLNMVFYYIIRSTHFISILRYATTWQYVQFYCKW